MVVEWKVFLFKRGGSVMNYHIKRGYSTQSTHEELPFINRLEIENQLKMIDLTPQDLQLIHKLQPYVLENVDKIVDDFYKNLEIEPSC